nr:MAG TPA: hypothetical protein [Caudoviricetes sp.]
MFGCDTPKVSTKECDARHLSGGWQVVIHRVVMCLSTGCTGVCEGVGSP